MSTPTARALMRRRNLSTLLRAVTESGRASVSVLTAASGLNRSTVHALLAELAERGLVQDAGVARGGVGRPSHLVQPRPDGPAVLVADVTPDGLRAAVTGLDGALTGRVRHGAAPRPVPAAAVVDALAGALAAALADLDGARQVLAAVVAVPGVVDDDGVVHAPQVGLDGVPLAAALRPMLPLGGDAQLVVGNAGALAGLAEHRRGAGVGAGDLLHLGGRPGDGCGIVVDGRLVGGTSGYAGAAGHLTVADDGAPCTCGLRGCLEVEASAGALLRRSALDGRQSERALAEALTAADHGHPAAVAALHEVGHHVGTGLAHLARMFPADVAVLGGFLGAALPHLRPGITAALGEAAPAGPRHVQVLPAALGADGVLHGAGLVGFEPLLVDPTLARLRQPAGAHPAAGGRGARDAAVA